MDLDVKLYNNFIVNLYKLLVIEPEFVPNAIIKNILLNKSEKFINAEVLTGDVQTISNHRKTKWLDVSKELSDNLVSTIFKTHESIFKPLFNSNVSLIEPPQFLRYDVGDYYKIHNDSEDYVDGKLKRIANRDISVLFYLNDDFEGGELEFTKLQIKIKPKSGMMIAFPSYIDFEHIVHPVTKGTRYTLVSWIITEKRIYERPYDVSTNIQRTWFFSN